MNPIATAIRLAGGPAAVAQLLGLSTQAVCFYRDGRRALPPQYAATVEKAGGCVVRRWEMFPQTWHRIWPELIDTEGAPDVPTQEVRDAA